MPYCTQSDITDIGLTKKELIQLTDDDNIGEVNSGRVTAAILKADTEIDGYCRTRYTVPFVPIPDEIKFLSVDIATYWLFRRRQQVTSSILDKYTKALSKLKRISEGDYTLDGVTLQTDSTGIASTIDSTAVQTFTRTKKDSDGNVIGDKGSMETW